MPADAVDDEPRLLDDLGRALVGAHAHGHGVVQLARVDQLGQARRTRRGRSRRRRRTARRAPATRSRSSRTARSLPIGTGGRISSTLRPQWVHSPSATASEAIRCTSAWAASSSGAPAPVEAHDRALVLDPHAQRAQLRACRARARTPGPPAGSGRSPASRAPRCCPARAAPRRGGRSTRSRPRPPACARRPPRGPRCRPPGRSGATAAPSSSEVSFGTVRVLRALDDRRERAVHVEEERRARGVGRDWA